MIDDTGAVIGWRRYAHGFFLSGSYWFGLVALLLQAADYKVFGLRTTRDLLVERIGWWGQEAGVSGVGYVLRGGMSCALPCHLWFSAGILAVLGTVLALVAFALRWWRPIPCLLGLLLNAVPATVSLWLIFRPGL